MARQDRAIRTRQAIVVAAAKVFDEVGYEAATISEILNRSGVTKGALYFHFASKEELAQEVLAKQVSFVPAIPQQELLLQEAVDRALLLSYLVGKMRDPVVRGSIRLTVEQGVPRDGLDRSVPIQEWVDFSAAVFEEAKVRGEVLPHVDAAAVAKLFVGAFTGVQLLSSLLTQHTDITERTADLYRHLMAAIAVPSVLVRLEIAPERAARVYEEATKQDRDVAAAQAG
ncbi:ScbR family autoregulator-binding transcription factor [Streptomyces sp. UG1]|uniref:ScbR family autoregulator-binding transcription factor n=1 Tax=Streptomyces sp. UG1 TaxID=3417652 RepID=UPI003CF2DF17